MGEDEVIVLLELVTTLEKEGRNTREGKIIAGVDCKRTHEKIDQDTRKSNRHAQDSGADIAMIKQLWRKLDFEVEIKLMRWY